jgi:hypothetical protein
LILESLGRRDRATAIAARLAEIGYRHPSFVREQALASARQPMRS